MLEDLSVARAGGRTGAIARDDAFAAVDALADFHAVWWDSPQLASLSWMPRRGQEVHTIVHGDVSPDSLFFGVDDAAVAAIGWRRAFLAPDGVPDLVQFLGNLDDAQLDRDGPALVARYRERLAERRGM